MLLKTTAQEKTKKHISCVHKNLSNRVHLIHDRSELLRKMCHRNVCIKISHSLRPQT